MILKNSVVVRAEGVRGEWWEVRYCGEVVWRVLWATMRVLAFTMCNALPEHSEQESDMT